MRDNSTCGNSAIAREIRDAEREAKCLYGLGELDQAIRTLIFHVDGNDFSSNTELVKYFVELLLKKYPGRTPGDILAELENNLRARSPDPRFLHYTTSVGEYVLEYAPSYTGRAPVCQDDLKCLIREHFRMTSLYTELQQ